MVWGLEESLEEDLVWGLEAEVEDDDKMNNDESNENANVER